MIIIRGPRDAFWPKAKKRRDSTAPSAFKRSGRAVLIYAEAARTVVVWLGYECVTVLNRIGYLAKMLYPGQILKKTRVEQ